MELTLTADGQCVLDRSLMERIGALPGEKIEVSPQEDGSLRICAKDAQGTLSAEELVRGLEQLVGHAQIVRAPIEEIQQVIAEAYVARGMRGLE